MAEIVLDGRELTSMEEVHALFIRALALPEHYGRSLDALFDCLTDLKAPVTVLPRDATVRLRCRETLEDRLGRRGRALVRLLRRAAEENPRLTLLEE